MNQPAQNGELHRADLAYRRTMQKLLVACVVLGVAALALLNYWLARLNATLLHANIDAYQQWMHRMLAGMGLLFGIGMAAFGLWLQRVARQASLERRWPPSRMKTSADVRIRYLTSADSFVQQLRAAAWALWTLALALFAWAGWLLVVA